MRRVSPRLDSFMLVAFGRFGLRVAETDSGLQRAKQSLRVRQDVHSGPHSHVSDIMPGPKTHPPKAYMGHIALNSNQRSPRGRHPLWVSTIVFVKARPATPGETKASFWSKPVTA